MTRIPDKRRWSTRTSYPSVAKRHLPVEVSAQNTACICRLEQELITSKHNMTIEHKTTMSSFNHRRKLMEKSMLKYSERMKEITDSRTTVLFRKILEQKSGELTGTEAVSEPVIKQNRTMRLNNGESEFSFGDNLNVHECRTVNCKCPFYGMDLNGLNESNALNEPLNNFNESKRYTGRSSGASVVPKVTLPKILLKRSSSADLLKLSFKTHIEYACHSDRQSIRNIYRTRG